jgi:hypothetical protein
MNEKITLNISTLIFYAEQRIRLISFRIYYYLLFDLFMTIQFIYLLLL